MFKKFLNGAVYLLVFFVLTFSIAEIWFRIDPEKAPLKYYRKKIKSRLWEVWLNEKNTDPLCPPFKIFSNQDIDNIERLRKIVQATSLPKNTTLRSYDFLRPQDIKEETSYTATINNLGFRDPPRAIEKPRNVFRIVVLGAYQAFGHGVNDEETYSRQLEGLLNGMDWKDVRFEVWNGGRHAASAIVGWARLRTEILNYKPDLLIWDYGHVDSFILGDDHFPVSFVHPDTGIYKPWKQLYRLMRNINGFNSVLFYKIEDYFLARSVGRNVAAFMMVNLRMMQWASTNNIPVIFMRQSIIWLPAPSVYQALADQFDNVVFVSGKEIFRRYPPSENVIAQFRSGKNWAHEYDPELQKADLWWPPEYFLDIFQYNKWGHKAMAHYLADLIVRMAGEGRFKIPQYK